MESYKERLLIEHKELTEKIVKLKTFINGSLFPDLDLFEQTDLKDQLYGMTHYCNALERRMKRKDLL